MPEIRILAESDLRQAVGLGAEELEAVESVYPLISNGTASMPPIMRIDVLEHRGEIDVKSAYLPGHPGIAIKVSAGFFDNPSMGLPSLGGLMMVLDSQTGIPTSALFDNGFLTDLRTGLAGAVAAKHLAPEGGVRVGVLGAGVQALLQLRALTLVRPISHAILWARRPEAAMDFAETVGDSLGAEIEIAYGVESLVQAANVVVTTTPCRAPLIERSMLHPGLHVTAVGSDAESKQELDESLAAAADLFVCDSLEQSLRLGELRSAVAGGFDPSAVVELGEIVAGATPGRVSDDQITICDLTGTGAQDTAIASLAVERCAVLGLGTTFET